MIYETLIRYKWTCDGINSIEEGIEKLKERIAELKMIKEYGGKVDTENNQDDYIRFYGENPKLKEIGFEEEYNEDEEEEYNEDGES